MLSKLNKYGALNNIDAWKSFAIITMFIDHAGMFFFPENTYLRAIGRLSAPIWFFFAGIHFDSKPNKDLFFYAFLMAISLSIIKSKPDFSNILISIILIKYAIFYIDRKKLMSRIPYFEIGLLWLSFTFMFLTIPFIEYGSVGLLFAYCGYLHKIGYNPKNTAIFFAATILIYLYAQQIPLKHPSLPMLLTGLSLVALMTLLYRFKMRAYQNAGAGANCLKFLSRYSMEIYFFHFIVLTAITHYTM